MKKVNNYYLTLVTYLLLMSCKANNSRSIYINDKEIVKVEIVVNELMIPLDTILLKDFINSFNKCKIEKNTKSIVYNLDLNIYKNDSILNYKSNGNSEYANRSKIFRCKENLVLKYWGINEENIPLLKPPKNHKN